ncbi:MAG: alpha-2-macroglobulin, partial [Bacteroidales bacterium]|nr:alpha-2-macroglobulin [Bacteroidales bacterium]
MKNAFLKGMFLLAAVAAVVACGPKKKVQEPSARDYAPYIKAYTGGIVTGDAPIRVDLTEDVTEMPTENLFVFKPAVKGDVKWNGTQSVSFIPEEGALKEGLVYQVQFALGKLIPGAPDTFDFGITVKGKAEPETVVEQEPDNGLPFRVVQAHIAESAIEVELTDVPANATVKGMVELKGAARSYVQVQGNLVKVHFEGQKGDLTLTLDKSLKNDNGATLGQDYVKVFKEQEEKPAVEFPFTGNILPDKQNFILPFRAVNLSAVEVRVVKIYEKNILMFLQDNDLNGNSSLRRSGRLVYRGDIALDATKDLHQWNTHSIDLSGLFKQEPGAIYRIRINFRLDQSLYGGKEVMQALNKPDGKPTPADEAEWDIPNDYYWENFYNWELYNWKEADDPTKPSYYMDSSRFPAVQLLSSDLGLMADYAGGKQLWVAATDLITAKPVSGAKVEVYDYQLQEIGSGKTDANGLATLDVIRKPFAVVAKAGGSTAYLKVTNGNERSTSRFDVGGEVLQQGIKAYIYGERGVWRPGDTLHVTAIVAEKGKSLPSAHPATLEIYTPAGAFYGKYTRKGTDSFFSFDIPTKADDPTGYWNAYLKVGGSSFNKVLHIETVKPNRLKVNTEYPALMEAGKTVSVPISAAWLSGGVAGNLPVRAQISLKKASGSPFAGFEKYNFFAPSAAFSADEQELFKGRLDASGNITAKIALPAAQNAPGMLQAFVVTSVEEPGGDESFTTETIPYSPYSAYVGVRVPDGEYLETDKAHYFKLAVVDAAGQRVKGHQVEYAVYKAGWNWWWDNAGGSLDAYVNGSSVEKVQSGELVAGQQDASFTFQVDYPAWGNYLVLARDKTSGHVSGARFTVDWPEYRGRADRRYPESLTLLTFSTSNPSYQVGEKATIYIPAAEGGQALVTLENAGGVIAREWVKTSSKDTPWNFTVTADMAPNIYAGVTLLQPYGSVKNDLPIRLYGVQRIKVENPGSHLEPVVTMPDVIHPEEPFTVKVSERSGKPMTYTLAIVDEGLLDLTAFKTPDPWSRMYKNEALTVSTWDLYDQVIGAFGGKLSPIAAIGGDEDAVRGARKDNRFNPAVLYRGPKTIAKGSDVL